MKKNRKESTTELVFIIDRSGSMMPMESDTIGGYNAMIKKQKKQAGTCHVTTVFFNNQVDVIHNRIDLKKLRPLPASAFAACGCTAMLDAVGSIIDRMINVQRYTEPAARADKVLFVIITDGMENASHWYSWSRVREMIRKEKEEYGWEFLFLGANIDAQAVAGDMGIEEDMAATFHCDTQGMNLNFETMAESVSRFRAGQADYAAPMQHIRDDFKTRGPEHSKGDTTIRIRIK